MKRILLDTSVYGELVREPETVGMMRKLEEGELYIFYGNEIVRKELRETPKSEKIKNRSLQILLLILYDALVRKDSRILKITKIIETVSDEYFSEYKKKGGGIAKNHIISDFLIIACASVHGLDILVSHDTASMLGRKAIAAYKKVNAEFQFRNPEFMPYQKFKEEIKRAYTQHGWRSD